MNDENTTDTDQTDQPQGDSVASTPGPVDPPTDQDQTDGSVDGSDGGSTDSSSEDDDGSADAGPEPKDPNDGVDPDAESCETPEDLLEDDQDSNDTEPETRTLSEVLGEARSQRKLVDSGSQRLG